MKIFNYLKNKSKLIRKRSLYRLKIGQNYYFSKARKEPIFIVAARRTGSNFLLGCLNSIPGVSFAPEILNKSMHYGIRSRFISKNAVLRHIVHSIYNCPSVICGAKIIRIHMETHRITLEDLKKLFPEAKFIILYRKSLLEQFISLKIAEISDEWQWTEMFRLPNSIRVEVEELERFCKSMKAYYADLLKRDWLKDCSVNVSYEDLVSNPQKFFDEKIFPFLGLPSSLVSAKTRKQNTKSPHEIVHNYQEIEFLIKEPLVRQEYPVPENMFRSKPRGFTLWFTGLPCSGKTTLSETVKEKLYDFGLEVIHLDGDVVRKEISPDLGFSKRDREIHVRRVAAEASLLTRQGIVTLVSLISPYRAMRQSARNQIDRFIEIYVKCPLVTCEKRDTKGMYRLAREGKIKNFTGVSDAYEEPVSPEIELNTDQLDVEACSEIIITYLQKIKIIDQNSSCTSLAK